MKYCFKSTSQENTNESYLMDIKSKLRRYYFRQLVNKKYNNYLWNRLSNIHNRFAFVCIKDFFIFDELDREISQYLYDYIKQDEQMLNNFQNDFENGFIDYRFTYILGAFVGLPITKFELRLLENKYTLRTATEYLEIKMFRTRNKSEIFKICANSTIRLNSFYCDKEEDIYNIVDEAIKNNVTLSLNKEIDFPKLRQAKITFNDNLANFYVARGYVSEEEMSNYLKHGVITKESYEQGMTFRSKTNKAVKMKVI